LARHGCRILVVDDEAIVGLVAKKALESRGYAVDRVTTGEEAVAAFEDGGAYELVVLDVELGAGIDGIEAARRITATRDVAIVFNSSRDPIEVEGLAKGIDGFDCVAKEHGNVRLVDAVELSLERREAESLFARLEESIDRIERLEARVSARKAACIVGSWRLEADDAVSLSAGAAAILGSDKRLLGIEEIDKLVVSDQKAYIVSTLRHLIEYARPYVHRFKAKNADAPATSVKSAVAYDTGSGKVVGLAIGVADKRD